MTRETNPRDSVHSFPTCIASRIHARPCFRNSAFSSATSAFLRALSAVPSAHCTTMSWPRGSPFSLSQSA